MNLNYNNLLDFLSEHKQVEEEILEFFNVGFIDEDGLDL